MNAYDDFNKSALKWADFWRSHILFQDDSTMTHVDTPVAENVGSDTALPHFCALIPVLIGNIKLTCHSFRLVLRSWSYPNVIIRIHGFPGELRPKKKKKVMGTPSSQALHPGLDDVTKCWGRLPAPHPPRGLLVVAGSCGRHPNHPRFPGESQILVPDSSAKS